MAKFHEQIDDETEDTRSQRLAELGLLEVAEDDLTHGRGFSLADFVAHEGDELDDDIAEGFDWDDDEEWLNDEDDEEGFDDSDDSAADADTSADEEADDDE